MLGKNTSYVMALVDRSKFVSIEELGLKVDNGIRSARHYRLVMLEFYHGNWKSRM